MLDVDIFGRLATFTPLGRASKCDVDAIAIQSALYLYYLLHNGGAILANLQKSLQLQNPNQ